MEKTSIKYLSLLIPIFDFFFVIILWQNMPHDGIIGKRLFFMMLPSVIIFLILAYLFYTIIIILNQIIRQIAFFLLAVIINIVTIFILFPCSQNFCATDIIEEIFYLRELKEKVEIRDIFRYEKEPFVQKLIIKKFKLDPYLYKIMIYDTVNLTSKHYELFFKNKVYSNNGNLLCKIDGNNIIIEDFDTYDKTKKIIYKIDVTQRLPISIDNGLLIPSNDLSKRIYINKAAIISYDFGFLSIAANWALL